MAYMCDSEDSTPAAIVLTNTETGDVVALCGPCYVDYCWSFVQSVPDYDERMKALMVAFLEKQEAANARANKRRRKAGEPEIPAGEVTGADGAGEIIPEQAEA